MKKNLEIFIQSSAIIFDETFESFPLPVHLDTEELLNSIGDFDATETRRVNSDLRLKEQTTSAASKRDNAKRIIKDYQPLLKENDLSPSKLETIKKILVTAQKAIDADPFTDPEGLSKNREAVFNINKENERISKAIGATLDFLVLEGYLREVKEDHSTGDYQLTAKGLSLQDYEIEKNGVLKTKSRMTKITEAIKSGSTPVLADLILPLFQF